MGDKEFHFQVNLGGMLDVLSNHLYSTPDVFLRELMQNSVDAITLRKQREIGWDAGEIHIDVTPGCRIVFRDNGAGLNETDIHQFLSVIGQSSKGGSSKGGFGNGFLGNDFTGGALPGGGLASSGEHYASSELARGGENYAGGELAHGARGDYIGRFGIGLLSCFMVTDAITVRTRRFDSSQGYEWVGRPDGTYTLAPKDDIEIGTTVVLDAKAGAANYYNAAKVAQLVLYYGVMLPVPIYLDGSTERLNSIPVDFKNAGNWQLMAFGGWLFEEDFIDAIPINTDHLSGVAFVIPYRTSQTAKQGHRIFLKDMLLTEDGGTLLPKWAFFLRCFLNTKNLRPTASREDFYEDAQLCAASQEFSDAVRTYLRGLAQTDPARLQIIVDIHAGAIKSMSVWDDDMFNLFVDYLPFVTSEGVMSGLALRQHPGAVYVPSITKFSQMKSIFLAQNRLLICTGYTSDNELIEKMISTFNLQFTQLKDDNIESVMADPTFDEWERTLALAAAADEALACFECKVQFKTFHPEELPALYTLSDEAQFLRNVKRAQERGNSMFSEVLQSIASSQESSVQEPSTASVLYLNLGNELVRKLMCVGDVSLVQSMVRIIYVQALVASGHPLHSVEMKTLSSELLFIMERVGL